MTEAVKVLAGIEGSRKAPAPSPGVAREGDREGVRPAGSDDCVRGEPAVYQSVAVGLGQGAEQGPCERIERFACEGAVRLYTRHEVLAEVHRCRNEEGIPDRLERVGGKRGGVAKPPCNVDLESETRLRRPAQQVDPI